MDTSSVSVQIGEHLLGKYIVERVLGQGGMGVVVQASHIALGSKVAIKLLLPEACDHPGAVERFLREARAAVQIHSEHVARVSDTGILDSGLPYMVMELLEGNDLSTELQERGTLPVEEAVRYLLEAMEAIAEAHALHIVHRDLKPANLFLAYRKDGSRVIKVLDFGISKAVQSGELDLTQSSSMMGSPLYMAPEQIRNAKTVDARADVWSLGVILHECLSGHTPFGGTSPSGVLAAIVADPPVPLVQLRPDLPPLLLDTVSHCLEKDPAHRVQNVAELGQLLAVFAPEQAQRSLPRIAAVLDRTLHRGTTISAPPSLAITAMDERATMLIAPVGEPATVTVMSSLNDPNWATPRPAIGIPSRSSVKLISGALGLVLVLGSFAWALGGDGREGAGATSTTADAAEEIQKSSPPQVVLSGSALTPVKRPHVPETRRQRSAALSDPAASADPFKSHATPHSIKATPAPVKTAPAPIKAAPSEHAIKPVSSASVADFDLAPKAAPTPPLNPLSGRK